MALAIDPREAEGPMATTAGDQCVTLRDIGWKGYKTMLRLLGDRGVPRMIYLDGDLWLSSPSFAHERLKGRLNQLIMAVVVELNIPCTPTGRTTFRRRSRRAGVEGDETYYLANESRIRGKGRIDLRVDPPPDLAIEVAHTHDTAAAVAAYRRLRVPEVWICDRERLRLLVLQADGRYARSERSAAFPFLTAAEVFEWVRRPWTAPETEWMRAVRAWARETVAPRRRGPGG
jgi:Uma2 family endonuclease